MTALNQLDRRTLYAWRDDRSARREKLTREDGTTYSIRAATLEHSHFPDGYSALMLAPRGFRHISGTSYGTR